jgi:benzoyl-CoA 2,3-dioxygenase component B
MKQHSIEAPDQVRAHGGIDFETLQRYLNFHYSVTLDLFGADQSSNAATFFSSGLKGRFEESRRQDDHVLKGSSYKILDVVNGALREREIPMLNALNEVLRDDFIRDSESGVSRWNKIIEKAGLPFRLSVPHKAFNRQIGTLSGIRISPDGRPIFQEDWAAGMQHWLPTAEDRAFVASLMKPERTRGKYAGWIAAPSRAINKQALDLEYVRFN